MGEDTKNGKPFGGPEWFWSPVTAAFTTLLIGGVAVIAGQPWLFPSLGPSIFLHVHKPNLESARLYNTVMGHLIGVAAGAVSGCSVKRKCPNTNCSGSLSKISTKKFEELSDKQLI